ncbi:tRNA lysidine(34) synthetase TilS [Geomobilimonas luticola]|uniref:tRNA(Ile)-lysidine synthase n=1 Tax=Geomobilimonas luticola TaxID=1114878 RepID=A0ABS5SGQ8_9BACT|nr:tRNA lysidine(34) synthetase TilS [Geomobilimonas luticola]MBT0654410.1 tRNA lysidine(34) synthetase TilS [Geomobilimonas luticola]
MFAAGDRVVVAVSGGADSVALLDFLVNLREMGLSLVIAHLNHQLRGEESDGDEAFVVRLAADYGLSVETLRVDVREFATRQRLSLEEAGRVARYDFFDEVAARHDARCIALAHHADDQAETVMLRLLRGAGGSGLAAMLPRSADGRYVRPFLRVTRREIEAYLAARNLSFRTDSSNTDTSFLRNRIRHELLPFLAGYNGNIAARLVATAESLAADEELLEQVVAAAFDRLGSFERTGTRLLVKVLTTESRGLRYRLYRHALRLVKGDLARIGSLHLQSIDRLVHDAGSGASLSLPGGCRVTKSYGHLVFTAGGSGEHPMDWEVPVEGPGRYPLPGGSVLVVEPADSPAGLRMTSPTVTFLDGEQAPFPWLVRNFRAGDRFVPLGMTGHKKVKNLLIDCKVPRDRRWRIPLVFSSSHLVWVAGVRAAAEARLTAPTADVLKVEILGLDPLKGL